MPSVDNINRYVMSENFKLFTKGRGSNFKLDTEKKNREINDEQVYRYQKITGLRTIKSAPFKKKVEVIDSRPQTSKTDKSKGPLFDHIDNASLFSSDSKSSIVKYNYKAIAYKCPSLNRQAEYVRRNLFKNYMKSFKETSQIYKINEPLLDKNQKTNVSTEIHALISSFRRDDTNQAFLRRHEELQKQAELAKAAELEKKTAKKPDEKIKRVESTGTTTIVVTTDAKKTNNNDKKQISSSSNQINNPETVKRVSPFKENKISDEELRKSPVKIRKATFDLSKNNQQEYPDLTASNLELFTDENVYETFDVLDNDDIGKLEKIENGTEEVPSPSIGYEIFDRYKNDDDKFYSKNKAKFMKDFEKGNLLINNFAREATQKREKCFKNTFKETPHAHTAKDLNLNTDSLKNELKRIRIAKILAFNNKKSDKNTNKENSTNEYEDEDDDDLDMLNENNLDDDEDSQKNKKAIEKQNYEMRVKKRQHYQVLLKYMYEKAKKNKIKIDSILSQYRYENEPKHDEIANKIEEFNSYEEIISPQNSNNKQTNFCISLPFKRDNISNYEIFIPKYQHNNNQLYLMNNTNNNNSSRSISTLSLSTRSETNNDKELKKELPLNYESLKLSGIKIIESKSKSTLWQNYNKKT